MTANLPPSQLNYATPAEGRSDLRQIAVRQRAIMYCILAELAMIALQIALPSPLNLLAVLGLVAAAITAAVFAFMLSMAIYSTAVGIIMGILSLIPYLGLLFLLIINGRATGILRAHNIKVGLMGADLRQIPDPGQIHI
jgi:hypothetical protein